eukprot:Tbor_TRINITY_DN3275_c0_g1::TRINITY_DN3275_c0_g1_i1::g.23733::m.23733/K00654/SPT; serine palmitoyltransferase
MPSPFQRAGSQTADYENSNLSTGSLELSSYNHTSPNKMAIYLESHKFFDKARIRINKEVENRRQEEEKKLLKNNGELLAQRIKCKKPFEHPEIPMTVQLLSYLVYFFLSGMGYIRDGFRYFFPYPGGTECKPGYAPMVRDFDDFFQRRFYRRIRDCWNRPINSRPSRVIGVVERVSHDCNATFETTGRIIPAINLGSYNYLGFADEFPYITQQVLQSIDDLGIGSCASSIEGGYSLPLYELEATVAAFTGKQDAIICGMGFATNFNGLPSLLDKDTLVFSDQLNHASLIAGVRVSAAKVKVFPHNRFDVLERMIEDSIVSGCPRTRMPYKRIVILVEGIYSMEGDILDLRRVVEIKKKYNVLLYVDEAHSIGALGPSGRGIAEHCGVSPSEVDIFMGTFSKSFGSIGGYISADAGIISCIRNNSTISIHGESLAPASCQQALSVFKMMMGHDGTSIGIQRIKTLADNAVFFREGLVKIGLTVYGEGSSPVIPVMIYQLGKMPRFSRELLRRNIAVVVVGYPATPLLECRARFCVSASHTRADLIYALHVIKEVAEEIGIIFNPKNIQPLPEM